MHYSCPEYGNEYKDIKKHMFKLEKFAVNPSNYP